MSRSLAAALAVFLCLASMPVPPALADDSSFSRAVQLYNARQYSAALQVFNGIMQRERNLSACYYAANCERAVGRQNRARELYGYLAGNYPQSAEGKLAAQALAALGAAPAPTTKPESTRDPATDVTIIKGSGGKDPDKSQIIDSMVHLVRHSGDRPPLTPGFVASIKTTLQAYPTHLLAFLNRKGCKIYLTPSMIDRDPQLAHTKPRGYEDGKTYKNCPGRFDGRDIIVCEYAIAANEMDWDKTNDPVGTMRHELGHAIDRYLGQITKTEEFRHAYLLDAAKVDYSNRDEILYYLQKDRGGPSETFAELICYRYGGRTNQSRRRKCEVVWRSFPTCAGIAEKAIARIIQ